MSNLSTRFNESSGEEIQDPNDSVMDQLQEIEEAVRSLLVSGTHYGELKSGKLALRKPGAERLMRRFNLGMGDTRLLSESFDSQSNLARYTLDVAVYNTVTGARFSCIGIATSLEKKHRDSGVHPMDILNTLAKTAHKRGLIGAVILALSLSDLFTQDEDEIEIQENARDEVRRPAQNQRQAYPAPSRFNQSRRDPGSFVVSFGKYKDYQISEIGGELADYLAFLVTQNRSPRGKMKDFIDNAREYLRAA